MGGFAGHMPQIAPQGASFASHAILLRAQYFGERRRRGGRRRLSGVSPVYDLACGGRRGTAFLGAALE
jgi:hypothetical protein